MRVSVALALCCLCTLSFAADPAHASIRKTTNIPAEELGSALQAVAKDYDFQVLYRTEIVKDLRTQGAVGTLTSDEALSRVLNGTGLTYRYLDDKTVTIVAASATGSAQSTTQSASSGSSDDASTSKEAGKKSSQDFRVAQVDQGKSSSASSVVNQPANSQEVSPGLSEIIVTAQKRNERLQDVPVPVTVINAESLVTNNQLRLEDYFTKSPGVSLTYDNYGAPHVSIRGLSTGAGLNNPEVGVVVDDVPYGSSTINGFGSQAPDIDPDDLARIEVLRGPQGTLYGASSLGGLLKYVTVDPSTDSVRGAVKLGGSSIYNGDGLGFSARASLNVPVNDSLAFRISGFGRHEPGYIDNVLTGQDGVNKVDAYGGRVAALWSPSADILLKVSALIQDSKAYGSSLVYHQVGVGDLEQSAPRDSGIFDRKTQAYSATFSAKVGDASITAITGYNVSTLDDSFDFTSTFGAANPLGGFNVPGDTYLLDLKTEKFTQEVRLEMPLGQHIDWLFGGFFDHESSSNFQDLLAVTPLTGAVAGNFVHVEIPSTFREYAAFTDVTLHFSDRFDLQIGGRESSNRQDSTSTFVGVYDQVFLQKASPFTQPEARSKDNSFTYLVTPRYKLSQDLMVYARLASGYRPGGPNGFNGPLGLPPSYAPDKTKNYEIGVKGDAFSKAVSFDASLYYIDWKNIQLQLIDPVTHTGYEANGSAAKSQGVEFAVAAHPFANFSVDGWVAFNDAKLTDDLPIGVSANYGVSGDRLPYSSRYSGELSLEQRFQLTTNIAGFVGGSASYLSDRKGIFTATAVRQDLPGYTKFDLKAGLSYGTWLSNLYVNNVADKRALIGGGLGTFNDHAFQYIQPRTIGVVLQKSF